MSIQLAAQIQSATQASVQATAGATSVKAVVDGSKFQAATAAAVKSAEVKTAAAVKSAEVKTAAAVAEVKTAVKSAEVKTAAAVKSAANVEVTAQLGTAQSATHATAAVQAPPAAAPSKAEIKAAVAVEIKASKTHSPSKHAPIDPGHSPFAPRTPSLQAQIKAAFAKAQKKHKKHGHHTKSQQGQGSFLGIKLGDLLNLQVGGGSQKKLKHPLIKHPHSPDAIRITDGEFLKAGAKLWVGNSAGDHVSAKRPKHNDGTVVAKGTGGAAYKAPTKHTEAAVIAHVSAPAPQFKFAIKSLKAEETVKFKRVSIKADQKVNHKKADPKAVATLHASWAKATPNGGTYKFNGLSASVHADAALKGK